MIVLFDLESELSGGGEVVSVGSSCTSAELDRPTKAFDVTSMGLRLMSGSSSESRLKSEVVDAATTESSATADFLTNQFLTCLHNRFLFLRSLDTPSLAPTVAASLVPLLNQCCSDRRALFCTHCCACSSLDPFDEPIVTPPLWFQVAFHLI